jgi:hypothetical protein
VLNGRYYFSNASYINTSYLLIPFRRIKYYLREVIIAKELLKTFKELFNL